MILLIRNDKKFDVSWNGKYYFGIGKHELVEKLKQAKIDKSEMFLDESNHNCIWFGEINHTNMFTSEENESYLQDQYNYNLIRKMG